MPGRGENYYKRKDGRWENRFKFDNVTGKYKYVYAPPVSIFYFRLHYH